MTVIIKKLYQQKRFHFKIKNVCIYYHVMHLFKIKKIPKSKSMDFSIFVMVKVVLFTTLRVIAILTSILNIIVFLNPMLKDSTYRLLLISSVNDLAYSLMVVVLFLIRDPFCIIFCSLSNQYFRYWLYIIIEDYLTSCLFMMNILIELLQSFKRYFVISNNKNSNTLSVFYFVIYFFLFSFIFYSPVVFLNKVVFVNNTNEYKVELTQFGISKFGRLIPFFLSLIRLTLATIVLFVLNVLTFVRFKKYFNRKSFLSEQNSFKNSTNLTSYGTRQKTTASSILLPLKASKNITLMLISISVLFSLGSLPLALFYAFRDFFIVKHEYQIIMFEFSVLCLHLFIIVKLFIYYSFNKMYRKILSNQLVNFFRFFSLKN